MKGATILMDLFAAFDMVWQDGLLYKLHSLNLPSITIRWIHNFLLSRTSQIKIDEDYSDPISIERGAPHGADLSPILYSMYVNDTPTSTQSNTRLGLYANKTAYWTTAKTTDSCIKNLQTIDKKNHCMVQDLKTDLKRGKDTIHNFLSVRHRNHQKQTQKNQNKKNQQSNPETLQLTLDSTSIKDHI